jgi:hypothetical protein
MATGESAPAGKNGARMLAETWDGTKWAVTSLHSRGADSEAVSVSCASASACMATWGGQARARARWWNGTGWTGATFASPAQGDQRSVVAVSCPSATSCTAVGSILVLSAERPLVEDWDGHRWRVTPSARPAVGEAGLDAVSCTAPGVCTAVGSLSRLLVLPFVEVRH